MERYKVVIIGSGNVACHLAKVIDKFHHVVQVYSRNIENASNLAVQLHDCNCIDSLNEIEMNADLYLISVSDDAIKDVIDAMPKVKGVVAHTSGSIGIEVLSRKMRHVGVFYPLQTFSKEVEVKLSEVPIFLEASDQQSLSALETLAHALSDKIFYANSDQRQTLHIAAVFACNFFNHLLYLSTEILKEKGYSLDVLYPLINVTVSKAFSAGAFNSQTGPAVRGDINTIHKHIDLVDPSIKEIYQILSQSIIDRHEIHKNI